MLQRHMVVLASAAATARGRHWCSQEARREAWAEVHVQVSGDVRDSAAIPFRSLLVS